MTGDGLPQSVKIGWRDFRIEDFPLAEARERGLYGSTHLQQGIIRIDQSHDARTTAATLLHEILHAIFNVWQMSKEDGEERIVSTIESGLATVWRDNPAVFEWIAKQLTAP